MEFKPDSGTKEHIMELKNYRRTDLALELQEEQGDAGRGIDFTERQGVRKLKAKQKQGAP